MTIYMFFSRWIFLECIGYKTLRVIFLFVLGSTCRLKWIFEDYFHNKGKILSSIFEVYFHAYSFAKLQLTCIMMQTSAPVETSSKSGPWRKVCFCFVVSYKIYIFWCDNDYAFQEIVKCLALICYCVRYNF